MNQNIGVKSRESKKENYFKLSSSIFFVMSKKKTEECILAKIADSQQL